MSTEIKKIKTFNDEFDIVNKIIVKIKCGSIICENLRENGLFFETIAGALDIARQDVEEMNSKDYYDTESK